MFILKFHSHASNIFKQTVSSLITPLVGTLFTTFFLSPIPGNITYYSRDPYHVGQVPLYSTYDYIRAYTTYGAVKIGSCGFPLTYQSPIYPFNITSPATFTGFAKSGDSGLSPFELTTLLSGMIIKLMLL